jgi:hypothetical protein
LLNLTHSRFSHKIHFSVINSSKYSYDSDLPHTFIEPQALL